MFNTNGLVNYWPINNDIKDYVGNTGSLRPVGNVHLASDRFNLSNSSIFVNNGYCIAPNGTYFSGDFTIIGWVMPVSLPVNSRLIDFSRGAALDNVYVVLSDGNSKPYTGVWNNGASGPDVVSQSITLPLNQWSHLASTLSGTTLSIYINGTLANSLSGSYTPMNVTRTQCYIGKNPWDSSVNVSNTVAYFDDIKIYNRALSQYEVLGDIIYPYL